MTTPAIINSGLIRMAGTDAGKEKTAAAAQPWIRDQLKEQRISTKIVPMATASVDELQVSTAQQQINDTPVKIVPIEPQTRAMSMNFRGEPSSRLIEARRVEMGFYRVSSELLNKTEEELLVYQKMNMPITKMIEDDIINSIQETEDRTFLVHTDALIQGMQGLFNGGVTPAPALNATSIQGGAPPVEYSAFKTSAARIVTPGSESAFSLPTVRPDFSRLFQRIDGRRLRAKTVLLTEPDFDYLLEWTAEDTGDSAQTHTLKEGWTFPKMMGRDYVRTIKTNILRPGNYYCFTDAKFFGVFNRLFDTKFWISKEINTIRMCAWESVGMVLVNSASAVKMEGYSCDATTNDSDGLLANVSPVAENQLGEENNQVAEGLVYPGARQF